MVLINPHARLLGSSNAVLSGRASLYDHRFAGPLSVKTVVSGRATWETADGRFELVPGVALVLNDGEPYEVMIAARHPVETFCLFFERGFAEDAFYTLVNGSSALLDAPDRPAHVVSEKLHFAGPIVAHMRSMHARMKHGDQSEKDAYAVACALAHAEHDVQARIAHLPSLRTSTRQELARRLVRAIAYLHANVEHHVQVADIAREACLSPFHFHRLFTAYTGTTPHQYLTRLRLARARALLQTGDHVASVAAQCGFTSTSSFTALYKRMFGVTPGAARKESGPTK